MRRHRFGLAPVAIFAAWVAGCGTVQNLLEERPGVRLQSLQAPAGHSVSLLADEIPKARELAVGTRGTVFVGSTKGDVFALRVDGGRVVERRKIVAGLTDASGVAFADGALFVSDRTRILRYDDIEQRLDRVPAPVVVIDGLPKEDRHGARFMQVGPDGKLYISIGAPCDVCEPHNDEYGIILRVNRDGTGREVFARGIRNTVGFDFQPGTRELWFTDNGQDGLGAAEPPDELNRVARAGEHFGFPYCHGTIPDPKFGSKRACSEFSPPAFPLGAHMGALGMRFVSGNAVAADLRGDVLVARHGSHPPLRVGYDVVRIKLDGAKATRMEPFLTGFLQGRIYWGRPVDVLGMPDGSVLVSDDLNGAIYRVARTGS